MPTYEYACLSCDHHIEVFQRFSDEPLTTCGVCGGPLRKVFHPAGILFKGSGFYATDSRSSRSGGGKEASDSAHSSKGDPGKTEAAKGGAGKSESGDGASAGSSTDSAGSTSGGDTSSSGTSSTKKERSA